MPDFSPVAGRNPAVSPIQSLQDIMGLQKSSLDIQQAKQNLATGAYTQQSAQAGAQKAQQEMGERQLLQKVMSEGKDPDGNPLRDEKNEVNAPALHAFASKYLPLTGQGVTQAIVNTQDARLKLNDTVRGLNQNYRNDLSGVLRSSINSNDDAAAIGAKLDAYGKQNPDAAPAIARAKVLVQHLDTMAPAQRNQALDHLAMEFQPAATTAGQTNPSMTGVTNPQGNTDFVNTNPRAPNAVGAPAGTAATGVPPGMSTFSDQAGNVWAFDPRNPGQAIRVGQGDQLGHGGAAGGGGGAPAPAAKPPQLAIGQKEDIERNSAEASDVRKAADQAPMAANINREILRISRDTKTYPNSDAVNKAIATVTRGAYGSDYQQLGKFLEKNAINAMQSMGGPPSDARLSAASAANGSTQFNPEALQAVTKFNDAATTALGKYRQAMDKAIGTRNPDYTDLPDFKAAWAKNFDVDVFRVENAIRDHDTKELEKIKKDLGPERMKELAAKRRNLEHLVATGRLPQ